MSRAEHAPGPASRDRRGYVLFALMLIYGFNFLDRQILVILQEPIKAEMALSDAQLGLLTGFSFALFYVIAGIPIAWWADRGNRKAIITLALSVWSAMTMLCGAAQSYLQLLLARIGVGIGEAGGTPPAHSMISDLFPPERRATALAIFTVGLYFGVAAGYGFGGLLGEGLGWRYAFLLAGAPGLLWALVFFFTVAEPKRGQWDERREPALSLAETLRVLRAAPAFWMVTLAAAAGTFVNYGTGNFNPSYLARSHGLSLSEVGFALAFTSSVSGALGTYVGGVLADRLGRRDERWYLWVCALGQALSVPFSLLAYLAEDVRTALAGLFLSHLFVVFMLAPSIAVAHRIVGPRMRALASSIVFFAVNLIGLGFGPLSVGALSDALRPELGADSLRYAQVIASLVSALAAVLFVTAGLRRLERRSPAAAAAQARP